MALKPLALSAVLLALAAGTAGYLATGSPAEPSVLAPEPVRDMATATEAEEASKRLLDNFGDVRAWLTLSDALIRAGRTETAVAAIETAIEALPGEVSLWVQLGVALTAHAQGEVVPAARLAFNQASALDPEHPAPVYFLGLAFLQSGDVDGALAAWEPLLERTPADAPWRPMIERMVNAGRMMKTMGVGQPGGPTNREEALARLAEAGIAPPGGPEGEGPVAPPDEMLADRPG